MKQTLILLAGYPGTGKSYFTNQILATCKHIILCSPDDIKEEYWDRYGFNTLTEKEALIQQSWATYYERLEALFLKGYSVISDYPFSDKQKNNLDRITKNKGVQVMTIRFVGDIAVLFERQRQRDLKSTRHLGHMAMPYHKGMNIPHTHANNLLDYEEFYKRCTTRGYGDFRLGKTIEVDVSDFTKVDYPCILEIIKTFIEES